MGPSPGHAHPVGSRPPISSLRHATSPASRSNRTSSPTCLRALSLSEADLSALTNRTDLHEVLLQLDADSLTALNAQGAELLLKTGVQDGTTPPSAVVLATLAHAADSTTVLAQALVMRDPNYDDAQVQAVLDAAGEPGTAA